MLLIMPERIGPKPPEQPGELSLFPLSRDVAQRSLARIARDPEKAALAENLHMQRDNPLFQAVLYRYFKNVSGQKVPVGDLIEGSTWTYSLLRNQAESISEPLPHVSSIILANYLKNRLETKTRAKEAGLTPASFMRREIEDITAADHSFGEAMEKITQYTIRRGSIYFGAIETYLCFKSAWEIEEWEKHYAME